MNARLSVRQLRGLLRPETALVGLILLAALVWFSLFQKTVDAQEQQLKLDRDFKIVRQNLESLKANANKEALTEQLKGLQSAPEPQGLPPLQEAQDVSSAIVAFAAEMQLSLNTFDVTRKLATKGKAEYPAVSYSIVAQGPVDGLLGVLKLAEAPASATLQKLEFARDKGTGSIASLDAGAGKVTVKLDSGGSLTLRTTDDTLIEFNGQRAAMADLETGAWVKVKFTAANQTATEIQARSKTQVGATTRSPFLERAWEMNLDLVVFYSK